MKKSAKKAKPTGRPSIELNEAKWKRIEEAASYGCSHDEIADLLGVSKQIFYRDDVRERFEKVTRTAMAVRRLDLRKLRITAANEKPLSRTARWVDANLMGWSEKTELSGASGGPVELALAGAARLEELLSVLARKR